MPSKMFRRKKEPGTSDIPTKPQNALKKKRKLRIFSSAMELKSRRLAEGGLSTFESAHLQRKEDTNPESFHPISILLGGG